MKTGLYRDLPFVQFNKDFLIFSPYCLKIIKVSEDEFKSPELGYFVENQGFLRKRQNALSSRIQKIGFTVTTDCNLNCKHCYANAGNNPSYMSPELALKIIGTVIHPAGDYLLISFFGGEPTLNMKTIKSIVDHTSSLGIPTQYHIATNGVMSDNSLDYIIENNMDVTVSMDGVPETNDLIRDSKSKIKTSQYVETTIKRLIENDILFQVRTTLCELNMDEMENFVNYCADLGVRFIHFEPLSIEGRAKEYSLRLHSPEYFVEKFKQILDEAARKEIMIISSFYMNLLTPSEYFCTSLHGDKLLFNPDGSVSLCYKVQSSNGNLSRFIIGRYEQGKDDLVIDKEKKGKWRKFTVHDYDQCEGCFAKYICGGGCPHRNFLSTGKLNEPDPWVCEVKKELIRDAFIRLYEESKQRKESIVLGSYIYESNILESLAKRRRS